MGWEIIRQRTSQSIDFLRFTLGRFLPLLIEEDSGQIQKQGGESGKEPQAGLEPVVPTYMEQDLQSAPHEYRLKYSIVQKSKILQSYQFEVNTCNNNSLKSPEN